MVADFRPQKPDPHRICITIGGSKIAVEYDVSTPTADLSTAKILINSTLSTPNAKSAGFDLMNMYLNTDLEDPEYVRIHISKIPKKFINMYNLLDFVTPDGWVFFKFRKGL